MNRLDVYVHSMENVCLERRASILLKYHTGRQDVRETHTCGDEDDDGAYLVLLLLLWKH